MRLKCFFRGIKNFDYVKHHIGNIVLSPRGVREIESLEHDSDEKVLQNMNIYKTKCKDCGEVMMFWSDEYIDFDGVEGIGIA